MAGILEDEPPLERRITLAEKQFHERMAGIAAEERQETAPDPRAGLIVAGRGGNAHKPAEMRGLTRSTYDRNSGERLFWRSHEEAARDVANGNFWFHPSAVKPDEWRADDWQLQGQVLAFGASVTATDTRADVIRKLEALQGRRR